MLHLGTLLVAVALDWRLGEPAWLYARVAHPAVLFGRLVEALERSLYPAAGAPATLRLRGVLLVILLLCVAGAAGALLAALCRALPLGWLVEGALLATLLAWRSLVEHVRRVGEGLAGSLAAGRDAVRHIVGRDPESLDAGGVGRAAVESLAENFSDGIVAPLFWALLLGLPGALLYKAINTADSMIGHRSPRYREFGWAAARLDDLANLVPARLTAFGLVLAAGLTPDVDAGRAARTVLRDARRHRSPNAGWPEAAMAGALGLRLAGPRRYGGEVVADAWLGDGRAEVGPRDVDAALDLARRAYLVALIAVLALYAWASA